MRHRGNRIQNRISATLRISNAMLRKRISVAETALLKQKPCGEFSRAKLGLKR